VRANRTTNLRSVQVTIALLVGYCKR